MLKLTHPSLFLISAEHVLSLSSAGSSDSEGEEGVEGGGWDFVQGRAKEPLPPSATLEARGLSGAEFNTNRTLTVSFYFLLSPYTVSMGKYFFSFRPNFTK